jgi:putative transposase
MEKTRKAYPSDTTAQEWQLIMPYLPEKSLTGRPMKWEWRAVIDGIFYVLKTGCQWRYLPGDFPPWQTVYRYHYRLIKEEFWRKFNDKLSVEVRLGQGREAQPSAASLDSQSVKASDTASFHGYDAGKKIKGIKRHIMVDTQGLLITAVVHSAREQDYDGAKLVFERAKAIGRTDRLELIWVDGIYDKARVYEAAAEQGWKIEVVKRSDDVKGFVVLPRRWVVERTFSWLMMQRRLARDYERKAVMAEGFIYMSMCRLLLARLASSEL